MSNLYMRKTSLVIGELEITDPLTIKFSVPFGDSKEVDTIDIKVYNLKDTTINSISTNSSVILSAGYIDDNGVIFNGTLKKKETIWEGLDKITTFKCIDANDDYISRIFKKTFAQNTAARTILLELISTSGLGLGDLDLPINFIYRRGKVLNGKIKALIEEIAKDCGAKIFINKGRIFIRKNSKGDNLGLDISKETGLIDEVEEVEETSAEDNKKKRIKGYKLKMLLNPRVTTDVILKLTSRKVSGVFRVAKGEHKCDGNTYFTEIEVI